MASSDLSQPTRGAPEVSRWPRAGSPLAAVAAAATLYFVIAAVMKTDALEWFGSPWRGDDVVVVKHEPTRAFGASAAAERADSGPASARGASASPKRTTRTRGRSSPAAGDGRDEAVDVEESAPTADNPGRSPTKGPTSPTPASAPAPAPATNSSENLKLEDAITVTLPPPLPPVEVTRPPVEVDPPPLPVNPTPLPLTPPAVPPLELPALP